MGHTINYVNTDSPETVQKALDDCKQWLGSEYDTVCKLLADDKCGSSEHLVRVSLMMLGIQGYPATALMNTFWKK